MATMLRARSPRCLLISAKADISRVSAEGGMSYSRLACRLKAAATSTYCLLHVGYMSAWFMTKYSNGNARRLGKGCLLYQMRWMVGISAWYFCMHCLSAVPVGLQFHQSV